MKELAKSNSLHKMKIYNTNYYPPLDKFCLSSWVKRLPQQNSYEVRVSDLVSYCRGHSNCTRYSVTKLFKELIFDGSIHGDIDLDKICIYT